MKNGFFKLYLFIGMIFFTTLSSAADVNDPLPSWNNGTIKKNIIQFVQDVTDKTNKNYVSPEERIATIDDDGTLWVEQPVYTQVIFMLSRLKELAIKHPEWKQQEPFKSVLNNNYKNLTSEDMARIFAVTSSGMSVEDYHNIAKKWLNIAENPHFKHHYTDLTYQPMIEVINYLHQNNFKVYIVSGGGQDFMRAFSQGAYDIPPEQVIGSTSKTQYVYQDNKPALIRIPQVLFISDKTGKPEAINLFIGKKPIIAFGNSDGDKQMLEWTQSNSGKTLMLLVHHDDAKREYAYDTQSKIGTFPTSLFDEAKKNNWRIISMKNDWKTIFPFEAK